MNGDQFIEAVRKKLKGNSAGTINDGQIADYLGLSTQALKNWQKRKTVTVRQMVGVIFRSRTAAIEHAERQAIRPIVEFCKLTPTVSPQGAKFEIFAVRDDDGTTHPYLMGLKEELEKNHGIYVFHDSRGRALYTGKAQRQTLWREINIAFNRERAVQKIKRVGLSPSNVK